VISIERLPSTEMPPLLTAQLRALCWTAFETFTDHDFEHAHGGDHVVVLDGETLLTHAAVVPRTIHIGERELCTGYVEAVSTLPASQGLGLGSKAMKVIGTVIRERYEFGALSTTRHTFYERLGWECWQGPSYVIGDGGGRVRTRDEDDGIMVLRHGPTADVDLTAPIACHDRSGDAW
jgi:aminoglycoside 2'-N-acetyltransferase I